MLYFAHRGASAQRVQNTCAAFARARELGATHYELDVHLLRDGSLAVHHDYDLCTADGKTVPLAVLTRAELKNFPLKNPFSAEAAFIPLLSEVLPLVRAELDTLNIELKNDGNRYRGVESALLGLLARENFPLERVLFSSFDLPTLARLRAQAPAARIGVLTRAFDVRDALALRAGSVHLNHTRFTPEIARVCHANGLRVLLYTVNEPALAEHLAGAGADGIFTDCIDKFVHNLA